jgi:hypothetical protein
LLDAAASSVDAQDQLDFPDLTCMIHTNPANYDIVVLYQSIVSFGWGGITY